MSDARFRNAVEAAMLAAGRPLSLDDLLAVFADSDWRPERKDLRAALGEIEQAWTERALELVEVGSGWRFQVRREYSAHLGRLWSEKPPRYSRALMETLAIIAYRQPVTRGEIEEVRGVAVSPSILKTLQERDWIRVLGHKEIPGRPELLGTTRQFLDDFSLASLESLPPLAEIRDLDTLPDDLFPETRRAGVPPVAAPPADGEAAAGEPDDAVAAESGRSPAEADTGDRAETGAGEPEAGERAPGPAADDDAGVTPTGEDARGAIDAGAGDEGEAASVRPPAGTGAEVAAATTGAGEPSEAGRAAGEDDETAPQTPR